MLKCLRCGKELRVGQECTCTQNFRMAEATPKILQKDLKAPLPTSQQRPTANASAVPTFSELLQRSKSQAGKAQTAPMGFTPLDEEGNLLTPAMRLAPRVNLMGKVEVPVAWTETAAAPSMPAFDFSNHPAFDNLEELVPLPSESKDAAWAKPLDAPKVAPPVPSNVMAPNPSPSPSPSPSAEAAVAAKEESDEAAWVAETAPGWRVLGAFLLDGVLVLSFVAGFWQLALKVVGTKNSAETTVLIPMVLFTSVVAWVYSALFGFLLQGRSFGRLIFGIRLVDSQGEAPSMWRAAVRATLSLVSLGLFFGGFYMALFSRSRQTLHDWLTRTFPVRLKKHRA